MIETLAQNPNYIKLLDTLHQLATTTHGWYGPQEITRLTFHGTKSKGYAAKPLRKFWYQGWVERNKQGQYRITFDGVIASARAIIAREEWATKVAR